MNAFKQQSSTPHVWLGPHGYAWLEFGLDSRHAIFQEIAAKICREYHATLVEVLPNEDDDGKEYAELRIGAARLLLMRKSGLGIGLGAERSDVPLLLRIAAVYNAPCRGWRWPFYRLRRRLGATLRQ
jgi:hypothetical protein